ncbi:MAG: response regulator transcription factor [Deltaproteobacteria bacterium]|nr:response regulator transcription factor [Deltaproteobacteria bacterium]
MEPTGKFRILIIEDDEHIAEGLKLNLSLQGYSVRIAPNGFAGLQEWKEWRPSLIVLDIMLPGIDGLSVLQNIRLVDEQLPILILSAKSASEDKVKGLSFGVDDYLSKPFDLDEFLLRIERLLTRSSWNQQQSSEAAGGFSSLPRYFEFGNNRIDFETASATTPKGTIHLTEQEIKLLKLFIANKGKPLSRDKLLEIGWGYTRETTTRTVDNFIVRLRKYFEENPRKPLYFKSLRSVGYIFDPELQTPQPEKTFFQKLLDS